MFPLWCCLIKFGISSHDLQSLIIWLELISRNPAILSHHFTFLLTHLPPYVLILIIFVGYWLLTKASTIFIYYFLSFSPMEPALFEKIAPLQRRPLGSPSRIYPLLFDLNSDPSETTDLSRTRPERCGGAVGLWEVMSNPETSWNHICIELPTYHIWYVWLCIYIYIC